MILVSSLVWTHNFARPEKLFSANLSALALGATSAASFLSATGLTFTRASISTAQTSDQSIVVNGAIDDAMIGNRTTDNAKRGLVIQQTTFNYIGNSPNNTATRDLTVVWTGGTGVTNTTNYAASPTPANSGCTRVSITSGGFGNYGNSFTSTRRCLSSWQRSTNAISGNGDMQQIWILSAPGDGASTVRAASNNWGRLVTVSGATNKQYFTTVDGRDYTASGGQTARARDVLVDYVQWEKGDWASECTTLGQVKRDSDLLSLANGSKYVTAQGQVRFYSKFSPKFASTMNVYYQNASGDADATEAGWYLFSWGALAQNYAYIKASDKKLYVKIANGSEYVSTNAITFNQYDVVETFVAVGSGQTSVAKYKLNGGSWVDLTLADVPEVPNPGLSSIRLFSNSAATSTADSGHFPCWLHEVSFYNDLAAPSGIPAIPPSLLMLGNSQTDYAGGSTMWLAGSNFLESSLKVGGLSTAINTISSTSLSFTMPAMASMIRPAHPDFNGTSNRLATSLTLDDFFNVNAWSAWVLFNIDTVSADSGGGSRYANAQFFGDAVNAVICMGISAAGVHVVGGALGTVELVTKCSPGLHVAQAKYDGTNLKLRIDTGPWKSIASTDTGALYMSNALKVGCSYNDLKFIDGRIIDMGLADSALSDANFDNIIGYLNAQHRTTIGGVAPTSFDPGTLPLTGWWRAGGYSTTLGSGTWTGRSSAGSSGGRNLTQSTTNPASSAAGWPGLFDVQLTSPGGRSNILTVETWAPVQEYICTLSYDSKHTPYMITGTWNPRYSLASGADFGMSSGSTGFLTSSEGAPVFDGDATGNGGLITSSATISLFLSDVIAAAYQEGSLATVFKSTSSSPLYDTVPYNNPAIVLNVAQGTIGQGYGNWDYGAEEALSVSSHIYDGNYNTRFVPALPDVKHSAVSRWGMATNFDLSVDGALSGAGYDSRPTINNVAAHASFTNVPIALGLKFPGAVTEQNFPGTVYSLTVLNAKAPDYFITKHHKWAAKFGVGSPVITSLSLDVADTAGGYAVEIEGSNLADAFLCVLTSGTTTATASVDDRSADSISFTMPALSAGVYTVKVVNSAGESNPLSLIVNASPLFWLNAERAVLASGNTVASVPNSAASPVDLSVAQSDLSKRPTFSAVHLNFGLRPAVVHAGDVLRCLDSAVLVTPISQPLVLYGVARFESEGEFDVLVDSAVNDATRVTLLTNDSTAPWVFAGTGFAGGYSLSHQTIVFCAVYDGPSNSALYINGDLTPYISGDPGTNVFQSLRIGAHAASILEFDGAWTEIGMFQGSYDEDLHTHIASLLCDKYSIPPFLYTSAPGSGGTLIITGSAMAGATSCQFVPTGGGLSMTATITVNTATSLTCTPPGTPGSYDVTVTNANGESNVLVVTL